MTPEDAGTRHREGRGDGGDEARAAESRIGNREGNGLAERNRAFSRALLGMDAPAVTVETHLPGGLPGFTLVGLPETAVREARDRVKSAIQNCGLDFPQGRVVVNLAPADLVKEGARFDLAIAVSILCATGQLPHQRSAEFEFLGELGLFGELRAVRGCLCAALALSRGSADPRRLVIPAPNAGEARLCPDGRMLPLRHLQEVVALLRDGVMPRSFPAAFTAGGSEASTPTGLSGDRLDDVIGQQAAKRALILCAAGGHHLLMVGPPGTGKTMLAHRLPALLPALSDASAMEVAAVYSAAGLTAPAGGRPPFREPHHSASAPAMAGGGAQAMPGEISLAHAGVLFLDELPHFKPSVLDLLREPLEARSITIARARYRTRFPARFQLVAAMNPCPAGRICAPQSCRCSPDQVRRYQARISGPLLDRIDLHVAVLPVPQAALLATRARNAVEGTGVAEITAARDRQLSRQGCLNTDVPAGELLERVALDGAGQDLLARASAQFGLSARSVHRILRAARTIADLAECATVAAPHLAEALSYRALDWERGLGMTAF